MLSGLAAAPAWASQVLRMIGYSLRPRRYPLFRWSAGNGGWLRTVQLRRALHISKFARLGGRTFVFLSKPAWPSKAYDRMVAGGGLNMAAAGTPLKTHIDMAILAVTGRCSLACAHCYERDTLAQDDVVPPEVWAATIRQLQAMGTGVIVLSGGEPMLAYERTLRLLGEGNPDLSDFHVHTSGHGVTPERAVELRRAGLTAAGVGLDDSDPDRHNALRGSPAAFSEATAALEAFRDAGVFTYLNTCLSPSLARSGRLWDLLAFAADLGVGIVRLLEPKPCGGYAGVPARELFDASDRAAVTEVFIQANTWRRHRRLPLVAYEAYFEAPERMGCLMGGLSFFAIDSRGHVKPCVFLPVSFGSILLDDIATIVARMRASVPRPLHSECPAIGLAPVLQEANSGGGPVPVELLRERWDAMWAP